MSPTNTAPATSAANIHAKMLETGVGESLARSFAITKANSVAEQISLNELDELHEITMREILSHDFGNDDPNTDKSPDKELMNRIIEKTPSNYLYIREDHIQTHTEEQIEIMSRLETHFKLHKPFFEKLGIANAKELYKVMYGNDVKYTGPKGLDTRAAKMMELKDTKKSFLGEILSKQVVIMEGKTGIIGNDKANRRPAVMVMDNAASKLTRLIRRKASSLASARAAAGRIIPVGVAVEGDANTAPRAAVDNDANNVPMATALGEPPHAEQPQTNLFDLDTGQLSAHGDEVGSGQGDHHKVVSANETGLFDNSSKDANTSADRSATDSTPSPTQ